MKQSNSFPVQLHAVFLATGAILAFALHRVSAGVTAMAVLECSVALAYIAASHAPQPAALDAR
jgi:hypothetical protein